MSRTAPTPAHNTAHTPAPHDEVAAAPARDDGLTALPGLLWRRRLLVVVVIALVAASVGIGLTLTERTYTAQSRVAVVPSEMAPTGTEYEAMLRTVADVALSRPALAEVQRELGDRSLTQLRDQVESGAVSGTMLVQVSVTDPEPRRAAEIANAVVGQLPRVDPSNGSVRYEVTEPADVPLTASSPNLPATILAGGALAIALSVALAVAYDRVARTVETADDLTVAGLRVLGIVGAPDDPEGIAALEASSARFSDLRALRVGLEFASIDDPTRTLVVAGAAPGPANGWLAVNLAVALAGVGHRVLLVDADRTDGRRHPVLDGDDEPGLYDVLSGHVELGDAIGTGPVDGVEVLALGCADQAAPSLLEMRFRRLLDDPGGEGEEPLHDVVVVNAAPVTESDDARVMAVGGGLLLTVPSRRVKPAVLDRAVASLRAGRTRVLGAVLLEAP